MKKIVYFLLFVLVSWLLLVFLIYKGCLIGVSYGKVQLANSNFLSTRDGFIFDTGANYSYISTDVVKTSIFLFPTLVSDSYGNGFISSMLFTPHFNINEYVQFYNFPFAKKSDFPKNSDAPEINSIIGMNVLSKTNLYISFIENTLDILPKDSIFNNPSNAVVINYVGSTTPLLSVKINNIIIKEILLDTGFDSDLALGKDEIYQLKLHSKYDTYTSSNTTILNTQKQKVYIFPKITIESQTYDNVIINQSGKKLLGLKFLRRFNHFFLDNKNNKIILWN